MPAHAQKVLRIVPHADLKNLDPIWTTAYITRNHGYMVYDTLFAVDEKGEVQPQMVGEYSLSDDGLTIAWYSNRDGGRGSFDFYYATRATPTGPFGTNMPITELNSEADEQDIWFSPDRTVVYFASRRPSGPLNLYMSTRAP